MAHHVLNHTRSQDDARDQEQILEISLQHTCGASFTVEARHHRVVLDQPAEDGATDQGMSPA
jgi:hypothetical protein